MAESAKKSTRVSNLEKMSPEKRAMVEEMREGLGQAVVDALNNAVMEEFAKLPKERQEELIKQGLAPAPIPAND